MSDLTHEVRAAQIGWAPREAWRGDPEAWVDAETFLKRGEEIMPILKQNNRRLEEQNAKLAQQLEELRSNMGEFVKSQQTLMKERLEAQRVELMAARKEARTAGDDDLVESLTERLEGVKEKERELEKKPTPHTLAAPPIPPEVEAWQAKNPWFGGSSREDQRRTALALQFGREAYAQKLVGQPYLDYIDSELAALEKPAAREPVDKTEGSRAGNSPASSSGSDYRSLPPEAKAVCDADEKRFVGPNKMFKDQAAWRKHFVTLYNS